MRQKKVLLYGKAKSLNDFFHSNCDNEFAPVAVVSEDANFLKLRNNFGLPPVEVFAPENFPKFIYSMIDGVVLIDEDKRKEKIIFLLTQGVALKKIIVWNGNGNLEFVTNFQDQNACLTEGLEFHLLSDGDKNFFRQVTDYLQTQRKFFSYPQREYYNIAAQIYKNYKQKNLDWNNLQTFTEKIQWLKLYDSTKLKGHLSDKYLVRGYVEEKIGAEYLIPLLGSWENFDDIDFEFLPEKFILKCNHAPNFELVVEKKSLDVRNLREKFNAWLQIDYGAQFNFEFQYSAVRRKILAEKFIDGEVASYKFFCFNGEPLYCLHENIFFDMDFDAAEFEKPADIPKPKNFFLLKKLAKKLCGDFIFVSVNFKLIDGEIFFDALDFSPEAGYKNFQSEDADKKLGEPINLKSPSPSSLLVLHDPRNFFPEKYSLRLRFAHKDKIIFPQVEYPNARVIASLTSWTKRISTVHLAVKSILSQSRQPDLTVLYLAEEEFPNGEKDLPQELTALLSEKFEIRWTKNLGSYKKIIPALKDFPEDIIAVFDDDHFYPTRTIERFLAGLKKFPGSVQFQLGGCSYRDGEKKIGLSRVYWDYPTHLNSRWGSGGALYPPHCFHKNILDEEVFMKYFYNADDGWIKMHLVLNDCRENFVEGALEENLAYIEDTQDGSMAIHPLYGESKLISAEGEVMSKFVKENYPQLEEIYSQEYLFAE